MWCRKFGPGYASQLRKPQGSAGDHGFRDEVMIVPIKGERLDLWRGNEVMPSGGQRRGGKAARFYDLRKRPNALEFVHKATLLSLF